LKRANLRRKWSTIPKAAPHLNKAAAFHNQPSRFTAWRLFVSREQNSPLFEIASVLVRFDHVVSVIINANHSIVHIRREPT
jgi:hypothetical protein